jgi:hypothetical protein
MRGNHSSRPTAFFVGSNDESVFTVDWQILLKYYLNSIQYLAGFNGFTVMADITVLILEYNLCFLWGYFCTAQMR